MLKMRYISGEKFSRLFDYLKGQSLSKMCVLGVMCMLLFACSTPKNVTYFKDIPDTLESKEILQALYKTPTVQTDDILQVSIQTLDPASTALLNQQNTASWPVSASNSTNNVNVGNIAGYLVDKDGYVALPLIGKILVKGKSTNEVREAISVKAAEYYKDPIVNVRLANFKITVLGEVARPSAYIMPSEKVSLLDAIGMAGDLTIYGKRENVLLIREKDGKKVFTRFNLNDSQLFSSPYFFLQQGDVIYVEPNKSKAASTDMAQVRRISIVASVLSLLIVIASRVNF